MVTISIEGESVILEVEAGHKLWALESRIQVAIKHIKRAALEPNPPMGGFDGLKMMGTDLPHIFRAGTFWLHGSWAFFDVRHAEKTIVLELENEHFAKLFVEVEDPEAAVRMLNEHLS